MLRIDGRRVSISAVGRGPALVCLPGGPGFPGDQLDELGGVSRSRTLLRVDWRGAGASDPPVDGRHAVADYVYDLAGIQTELGIERLELFGHSFGGIVAATYAATYPDRVASLVLDATPDRIGDGRAPQGGIAGYFASWDDSARTYVDRVMSSLYEPAADWFSAHEQDFDLRPVLPEIAANTLVITGDQDWAVGADRAHAMTTALKTAEAAVVSDAGHFAWIEQPDAYRAAVIAFLDRAQS